jgi:hypothetical protein
MYNKKIIAVILIASFFSACASRAPSNSTKTDSGRCQNSKSANYTYNDRVEKTEEKMLVWEVPVESKNIAVYGIQKLSLDKSPTARVPYLDVKILGKVKSIEYEARVDKHIQEKVIEARPISSILATGVLLGLPLIFAPGTVADMTLGCSEQLSSKSVPSQTDRTPTGKEQWVDYTPTTMGLRVVIGDATPIEKDFKFSNGSATIPLADYVNLDKEKAQINIKVECVTCKNLRNDDLGISYLDSKDIILDVNQLRAAEAASKKKLENAVIAAKQKADEDRARALEEKQKAADRAVQAKAESVAKAQAAEQKILDQYKEKCTNLGFKVGTDAFGKCVLQLTK